MGDLTENLSRHEFACKCGSCDQDTIDFALVQGIQQLADHLLENEESEVVDRMSVHINSGNRCKAHDRNIKIKIAQDKGIPFVDKPSTSQHLFGKAADFWMEYVMRERNSQGHAKRIKVSDDKIADYLENKYIGRYGIGRYNGRTHFDTRSGPSARWDNR